MAFYDEWIGYVKNWWLIGAIVGVLSLVISWLVGFLGFSANIASKFIGVQFAAAPLEVNVRQYITSGVGTGVGSWLMQFFSGVMEFTLPAIALVILSAMVIVIVGRIVYSYIPYGKVQWQKLAAVLLYGSIVLALFNIFVLAFEISALLALAIYWVILAFATYWSVKLLGIEVPN